MIGGPLTGTVNFAAVGLDYPSVAAWLKMISQLPSLTDLWVPNITKATLGTRDVVNFTSTRGAHAQGAFRPPRAVREGDEAMRSRVVVVGVLLAVVVVLIWNLLIFAPKGRDLSDREEGRASRAGRSSRDCVRSSRGSRRSARTAPRSPRSSTV